jgi:hypothetical protein
MGSWATRCPEAQDINQDLSLDMIQDFHLLFLTYTTERALSET